jgi:hypothetical protein
MIMNRKPITKHKTRKRLQTPADVRRLLAALINDLHGGNEADLSKAGKIGYLCNILVRAMETDFQQNVTLALQQRIEELEARLGGD